MIENFTSGFPSCLHRFILPLMLEDQSHVAHAAPEKEEECAPRQCCLATSAPSTVEAELATGEAASTGSFSRFSFRGSLNRQHEFNLHVNLSCCATRDEVHVKLTHLEGQLAVPDMDGHKFGVTNVKVQLHARAHKRPQPASPLQLSVVNLGAILSCNYLRF